MILVVEMVHNLGELPAEGTSLAQIEQTGCHFRQLSGVDLYARDRRKDNLAGLVTGATLEEPLIGLNDVPPDDFTMLEEIIPLVEEDTQPVGLASPAPFRIEIAESGPERKAAFWKSEILATLVEKMLHGLRRLSLWERAQPHEYTRSPREPSIAGVSHKEVADCDGVHYHDPEQCASSGRGLHQFLQAQQERQPAARIPSVMRPPCICCGQEIMTFGGAHRGQLLRNAKLPRRAVSDASSRTLSRSKKPVVSQDSGTWFAEVKGFLSVEIKHMPARDRQVSLLPGDG